MKTECYTINTKQKAACPDEAYNDGTNVFISLGSNIGDPAANLKKAGMLLLDTEESSIFGSAHSSLHLCAASSVYKTEPQNLRDQPFFCNQVLWVRCASQVTPALLLQHLFAVEEAMGRVRAIRFGPRVIDLDLLLFGAITMDSESLVLPHPRMLERAFVLVPLAEIAPELLLPQGMTVKQALESLVYSVDGSVILQAEIE